MQDEAIKEKIASFPHWHYRFDLKDNLTPVFEKTHVKRHAQRKKHFFDPLVGLFGGSVEGKGLLSRVATRGHKGVQNSS